MLLNFRTTTNQRQKIKIKYDTSLQRTKKVSETTENGNIIDGLSSRMSVEVAKNSEDIINKKTKHQATVHHNITETNNL